MFLPDPDDSSAMKFDSLSLKYNEDVSSLDPNSSINLLIYLLINVRSCRNQSLCDTRLHCIRKLLHNPERYTQYFSSSLGYWSSDYTTDRRRVREQYIQDLNFNTYVNRMKIRNYSEKYLHDHIEVRNHTNTRWSNSNEQLRSGTLGDQQILRMLRLTQVKNSLSR